MFPCTTKLCRSLVSLELIRVMAIRSSFEWEHTFSDCFSRCGRNSRYRRCLRDTQKPQMEGCGLSRIHLTSPSNRTDPTLVEGLQRVRRTALLRDTIGEPVLPTFLDSTSLSAHLQLKHMRMQVLRCSSCRAGTISDEFCHL